MAFDGDQLRVSPDALVGATVRICEAPGGARRRLQPGRRAVQRASVEVHAGYCYQGAPGGIEKARSELGAGLNLAAWCRSGDSGSSRACPCADRQSELE